MGRVGKTVILFFITFSIVFADQVSLEDQNLEPWLLLEKAKAYYRDRDFSTALNYLSYAQEQAAVFPEVEYWMGIIYQEEGEFILAEQQFLKAYELRKYLYIEDQQYDIAYSLAALYLSREAWTEYENILLSLVNGEMERDSSVVQQEHNLIRVLKEDGIDDLLYLYRMDFRYSQQALRELGVFYYKQENYVSSTIFNLYSMISIFSQMVQGILEINPDFQYPRNMEQIIQWDPLYLLTHLEEEVRRIDDSIIFKRQNNSLDFVNPQDTIQWALEFLDDNLYSYQFSGLLYTLSQASIRPGIEQYLDEQGFYMSLYYLACSLYGQGYHERAEALWRLLSQLPQAGPWLNKAQEQLIAPSLSHGEPIF